MIKGANVNASGTRRSISLILFIAFAVTLSLGVWLSLGWYHDRLRLEAQTNTASDQDVLGVALTSATNQRLALLQALRAFVSVDPDLDRMAEEFDAYAAVLHSSMEGIRTLTVSPGGTHQFVYPLAENEGVLGHDLLTDGRADVRDDVARAIATGKITLSGPYELRQGGLGLVARQAISSDGQFWGFVALVLDVEPLLIEAGFDQLPSQVIFALVTSSGVRIAGNGAASALGSTSREIVLPEGAWYLHIAPVDGWDAMIRSRFLVTSIPTISVACLLLLLVFILARRQVSLARIVGERTSELQSSEARWRSMVVDSPDFILTLDLDLKIEFANRASPGLAIQDLLGRCLYEFVEESDRKRVRRALEQVLKEEESVRYETTYESGSQIIYYESRAVPRFTAGALVGLTVVARDVSLLKRAEQEVLGMEAHLRQSQKLESLGTLASGVAHEINNPLMGMINYADLLAQRVEDDTVKEYSQIIIEEGNRIANIVRNLLSFSRQDKEAYDLAEIKDLIDRSLSLIGSVLRKDQISVELNIPEGLPQVKCRSQQIQQVIINLLTNAQHALNARYPEYHENKLIRITAIPSENDGENWIRMTVEDHGIGVPEDVRERIFDPFFSTKSRHEGTGLGLSVSFGIMKDHQGALSVESKPGEYTRLHVDLRVNNEPL